MNYRSITHVAVRVQNLREAERFYQQLFGLEVLFREAETDEGWATLPPDAGWEDAESAGVHLDLCVLRRDELILALERTATPTGEPSKLSHIGIAVSEEELPALHQRVKQLGCTVCLEHPRSIIFDDVFGVRWEVTFSNKFRSTGEATGRWLPVKKG